MHSATLTLSDFFSPARGDVVHRLAGVLESNEDLGAVREALTAEIKKVKWGILSSDVARKFTELLDVRIVDIMLNAWKKSSTLKQYLEKTSKSKGETMLLPLADHTITSQHSPYVELLKNGKQIARITFPIAISLIVEGIVLKIRDGEIAEIRSAQVKGKGEIKCNSVVILKKDLEPLPLPGAIVFDEDEPA